MRVQVWLLTVASALHWVQVWLLTVASALHSYAWFRVAVTSEQRRRDLVEEIVAELRCSGRGGDSSDDLLNGTEDDGRVGGGES